MKDQKEILPFSSPEFVFVLSNPTILNYQTGLWFGGMMPIYLIADFLRNLKQRLTGLLSAYLRSTQSATALHYISFNYIVLNYILYHCIELQLHYVL